MDTTNIYGIRAEGRVLCMSCAERIYGTSLQMYLDAGEVETIGESDRSTYAAHGLLCDDCFSWIIRPEPTEDGWWTVDPDSDEHLRLLEPFADFLETLQVDAMNLRNLSSDTAYS